MSYELKLEKFTGPLEKLLELIEERKLEISEVSMAQVTDDFLKYLKTLTDAHVDLRMIADFIVTASRLVLIKSKYLLPDLTLTGEEEVEIKDLERRLKLYQELRPAMKVLARLWSANGQEFSRPYFLARGFAPASPKLQRGEPDAGSSGIFYPGTELDITNIAGALQNVFESLQAFTMETETIREKIVSLEEKMAEIIKRFEGEAETRFTNLSSAKPRGEVIVIFLAILHLAREQLVLLEQTDKFSDIIIKKLENKTEAGN
ncbi:MAG: ScpA family protein [Candidatus Liptonbacteria bacterium]|nr:ScpA family protein [Candidatus Liptonbacteria bacterium]